MAEHKIINERPICLSELNKKITDIEKRDKELSSKATKVKEYLGVFAKTDPKKNEELIKKLNDLGILRLKERHIVKIVDIMPKDIDSLRTILSGETLTIKQEDLQRIVNLINE